MQGMKMKRITSDSYTCINEKNYRLHMCAAQSQKQAMPAKKGFGENSH